MIRRMILIGVAALALGSITTAKAAPKQPRAYLGSYTIRVTHYWWTGYPMASGDYPYIGAVACSADIPFGAMVQTSDGAQWYNLDTGALNGYGYSWCDFYGFDAEALYGPWADVTVYQ